MIREFPVTFSTPFMEFWKNACMTLPPKACDELRDALQFLRIWQDYFQSSHGEDRSVKQAFSAIRTAIPEAQGWTLATCHQWNDLHYFSAIDSPESGFEIKHKHP
ncbi:MAG: hypothetical protein K9N23_01050 [Akkermansiaceae bacterium]|nr:hypothetical protein [Akkermansiaceae bacterium]